MEGRIVASAHGAELADTLVDPDHVRGRISISDCFVQVVKLFYVQKVQRPALLSLVDEPTLMQQLTIQVLDVARWLRILLRFEVAAILHLFKVEAVRVKC